MKLEFLKILFEAGLYAGRWNTEERSWILHSNLKVGKIECKNQANVIYNKFLESNLFARGNVSNRYPKTVICK